MQIPAAWAPVFFWAGFLFFLSGRSDPEVPGWTPPGTDKVAHLVLYAVLGATLARAWTRTATDGTRHLIPLFLGGLYAVSDEWHQSFVPGRTSSAGDLVADILGLACGYAATLYFIHPGDGATRGSHPPA